MFADIKTNDRPLAPWGKILGKGDLFEQRVSLSAWQRAVCADFALRFEDDSFPCPFARKAWRDGTTRFAFSNVPPHDEHDDALLIFKEFTDFIKSVELHDRLFCPLVVFFSIDPTDHRSFHEVGWSVLNWLHRTDPLPWPAAIPLSPQDPKWSFCFNGVPLFINMSSPDHRRMRSRNLGRALTFIVNPRENFDAVASLQTKSGKLVRQNIRRRVEHYNDGLVPHELGFYGDAANLEWRQYQLSEPGLSRPAECPFKPQSPLTAPRQKPSALSPDFLSDDGVFLDQSET